MDGDKTVEGYITDPHVLLNPEQQGLETNLNHSIKQPRDSCSFFSFLFGAIVNSMAAHKRRTSKSSRRRRAAAESVSERVNHLSSGDPRSRVFTASIYLFVGWFVSRIAWNLENRQEVSHPRIDPNNQVYPGVWGQSDAGPDLLDFRFDWTKGDSWALAEVCSLLNAIQVNQMSWVGGWRADNKSACFIVMYTVKAAVS